MGPELGLLLIAGLLIPLLGAPAWLALIFLVGAIAAFVATMREERRSASGHSGRGGIE